jgi:hypothetical protein
MCGRVASPLLGRGAGGRSPGYLMSASPTSWPRSRWWPPELMSHPARSHHHRTRGEGDERNIKDAARNVKKSPAGAGLFTRGLNFTRNWMLSRKPGCEVYTKCLDTHPKPARLGSSSSPARRTRVRARRRRGPVRNSGGRSQPQLQTTYQRPSHQPRRRLRHHPLQPQSGVYTPDKDFLR